MERQRLRLRLRRQQLREQLRVRLRLLSIFARGFARSPFYDFRVYPK